MVEKIEKLGFDLEVKLFGEIESTAECEIRLPGSEAAQ